MIKHMCVAAMLIVTLAGCIKPEAPQAAANQTPPRQRAPADISTPDKALKSYWAARDDVNSRSRQAFAKYVAERRPVLGQLSAVATDEFVRWQQRQTDSTDTYSRDIVDVKVESESRAVIVASIKNTTQIPAGAEMAAFALKKRNEGDRYKYVLEKDKNGWRVAEIWEWTDLGTYPRFDWKKLGPQDDKPLVPYWTYGAA